MTLTGFHGLAWRSLLLLLSLREVTQVSGMGGTLAEETSGYIIVIDAGSTGSRAHVCHYSRRNMVAGQYPLIIDPPLTLPSCFVDFKVKPGLSAFLNHTKGLPKSLTPLLKAAADALVLHQPDVHLKHVPLYLGATAGMRELDYPDQHRVMQEVRKFFRTKHNPFAFERDEQARVLSGEEEGAFGWLSLNRQKAQISPDPHTTYGSLDIGGGSMQIAFVPIETSILANFFPMHFGGAVKGPIHLYTKSFPQFGFVESFQRATKHLHEELIQSYRESPNRSHEKFPQVLPHPCLPHDMVWQVKVGEYGVSTVDPEPERKHGPLQLKGTGNFEECQRLARRLIIKDVPCYLEPCSMLGVYQPELNGTKFVLFGEYDELKTWETLPLIEKGIPLLKALHIQLPKMCGLPKAIQEELFGKKGLKKKQGGQPPCWRGTWILTLLVEGLGFKETGHPHVEATEDGCCDPSLGQALYEANFFPYEVRHSKRTGLLGLLAEDHEVGERLSLFLQIGLTCALMLLAASAGGLATLLWKARRESRSGMRSPLLD